MPLTERPVIGLTLGDPAGIGPEIVVKSLLDSSLFDIARPIIFGNAAALEAARELVPGAPSVRIVTSVESARFDGVHLELLDIGHSDGLRIEYGAVQARAGQLAYDWFRAAIDRANAGDIDGIATAPVNKEAFV